MIETVYNSENGEENQTSKSLPSFKMPKNVRQIGKSSATKKIYVEDYVVTYLKQLVGGDYSGLRIAVLVGQCIKLDNVRNIFISGALEVSDMDASGEICFTNDIWSKIYEDIKKYFVETEIVGWYIGGPGYLMEDEVKIKKAHVDNFAGQDKTLFTFDNLENEESFFSYENSRLHKLEGYYIYYEKNEEMQTYIIDHKQIVPSEASYDDRVSREIRTVLQNKKAPEIENKNTLKLIYAAGTLLAVIVLVVGAAVLNNYDQMKSMQATLNYLSQNINKVQTAATLGEDAVKAVVQKDPTDEASAEQTQTQEDSNLPVQVIEGEVQPLENDGTDASTDKMDKSSKSSSEQVKKDTTTSKPKKEDKDKEASSVDKDVASDSVNEKDNSTEVAQTKYYVVQTGDTLADISFKLYKTYTKVAKIMELNKIVDKDLIFVGQKLIVP